MAAALNVLLIEDNPTDALLVRRTLAGAPGAEGPGEAGGPFAVESTERLGLALERLQVQPFDVVLLDLGLPDSRGLGTFRRLRTAWLLPTTVLTGAGELLGPDALREGAQDFIPKDEITGRSLARAIRYAIERHRIEMELRQREKDLAELAGELEQRVADRTLQLERQAKRLRLLANQLTRVEQQERRRLSYLLHENLQQLLVAASMQLDMARRQPVGPRFTESLNRLHELIHESIAASRAVARDLSPPILHATDLKAALDWLSRHLAQTQQFTVRVDTEGHLPDVPDDLKVLLFQAVRELLCNASRHGQVSAAVVRLEPAGERAISVCVEDQGQGFDPLAVGETDCTGFGLFNIRERLKALDGTFEVESAIGKGARFRLTVPVDAG